MTRQEQAMELQRKLRQQAIRWHQLAREVETQYPRVAEMARRFGRGCSESAREARQEAGR